MANRFFIIHLLSLLYATNLHKTTDFYAVRIMKSFFYSGNILFFFRRTISISLKINLLANFNFVKAISLRLVR